MLDHYLTGSEPVREKMMVSRDAEMRSESEVDSAIVFLVRLANESEALSVFGNGDAEESSKVVSPC